MDFMRDEPAARAVCTAPLGARFVIGCGHDCRDDGDAFFRTTTSGKHPGAIIELLPWCNTVTILF